MLFQRWSRFHVRLAVLLAAAFTMVGLLAVPASASSGGGCAGGYGYSFGGMWGCISASGSTLLPDGYIRWNSIPPGCGVSVELETSGGRTVAVGDYGCGGYHYGPLRVNEPSGTSWKSCIYVFSAYGTSVACSPLEYLSY